MRKLITLTAALVSAAAWSQPVFTNASTLLGGNTSSGGCVGVCDMNGDGLDDIAILDGSEDVVVKYQGTDGNFTEYDYGTISGNGQWGWAIGDIDNNGHKDIVSGGSYDGTHYLRITSPGVYTLTDLNGPDIFTQCMSLGDLDNDGRVDVFACHDDGSPNIWFTNAGGVPQSNNAYIDWSTDPASDMSGNYGSTFTDFDNDGDLDFHISHCRQGVGDPDDPRRWDRLFVNDGSNNYTDEAGVYGLENHYQTWTSDFGDYDNDGDLDVVSTNHDNTIMLFENDGTGHYTEVTSGSGLEITGGFLQGLFRDFDNDGFLDVITAGALSGSAHHFFQGHGDGTFTEIDDVFPASKAMHSFGIGDLNNDGFEDVFASYGEGYISNDPTFPDRLWLNTPNGNHWFRVRLKGTVSNADAIGARVVINGAFGTKVREVHAGESYGIVNSFALNFGLGNYTEVTSVVIHWPSGLVETAGPYGADQTILAIEGTCTSPPAQITPSGPPVLCTGGAPLTLSANPGYTYTWSTTETTESIVVATGGTYTVIVDDGSGCTGQASITVLEDPDETPSVSLDNDAIICQYDEVTLTSSPAASYLWSTSATTQSIVVDQSGTYSVTITGSCDDFTSDPVTITVLDAPDVAPTASDVFLAGPGTADLTATGGTNIMWYDVPSGGDPIGAGSPWTTPYLISTTTFWCADVTQYGGDEYYGGQTDRLSTAAPLGQYHSNADNYELFDAFEDLVIRSVKVYANGADDRAIGVIDYTTGTTVVQGTFSVPDGESRVDLNFDVPAGGPYGLRVMGGNPQLWRDGDGSNPTYPYALGTLGSITSSTVGGANATEFYYFFYDWEVETPSWYCAGPSTEVVVDVAVGMGENAGAEGISVYPNPADATLNITADGPVITVELIDITGRVMAGSLMEINGNVAKMDVSGLAPGEYLVRVQLSDRITQQRVVVR